MLRILVMILLPLPALAQDAIGRLNSAGYNRLQMCSGTLVAPDRVLTAAHCVADPETGAERALADMVFVAAWDGAGHAGAARVAAVEIHPDAFARGRLNLAHDLALIRLQERIDIAPMAVGVAAPSGPFVVAGYPRSRPHRLRRQDACDGRSTGRLWRIGCAVEKGQSGGPVLYGDGAAQRIVAIAVGRSNGETLAVPVDRWLRRKLASPATP